MIEIKLENDLIEYLKRLATQVCTCEFEVGQAYLAEELLKRFFNIKVKQ